jgi:hypothetical protein
MRARESVLLSSVMLAGSACYENAAKDKGDLIASEMIGPEGGTLSGAGITLDVPANAVTTETEFELRTAVLDLSARDYVQDGGSYALYPEDLHLHLPAQLAFTGAGDDTTLLFVQDGLTVAAQGSSGWINELATFALASEGTPMSTVLEPSLGGDPDEAGAAIRDTAHLRVMTGETPRLEIALTIYDTLQYYDKPLNGSGEGDCGFKVVGNTVSGGSLANSCASGPLTARIAVTSAEVGFDIIPDQAGKMEEPVVVGMVAGSEELAYHLGFFSFDTSPCYAESCSNYGVCEVQGDAPVCTCNPGYEPGPELTCECVPQCSGRECGGDSCGGDCAPGCNEGEQCTDEGQCVPDGSDTSNDDTTDDSSDATTTDDGGTTTIDPTTDDGSTTDPGTSSSTTM